jgi:hypothetical protein
VTDDEYEPEPEDVTRLGFASGVSAFTGEPFIAMEATFGDGSRRRAGQLTPIEARQHALAVLEAAEAAVHDAAVVRWLQVRMELEPQAAVTVLCELRGFRQDQDAEDDG